MVKDMVGIFQCVHMSTDKYFLRFLREPPNEVIGSVGSCEIPQHGPETKYTVYGPTNNEIQVEPGLQVPRGSTLSLDCENGYLHEDGKKNTISTCSGINEVFWNPPITNCFSKYSLGT